jgi:hypothetical protein
MTLAARLAQLDEEAHTLKLLAIAAAVQGREFSAAELLAHARVDADLQYLLRDATTPKHVGHRLAQLAARVSPGVRLVRINRNGDGCIWIVEIHTAAGLSLDARV